MIHADKKSACWVGAAPIVLSPFRIGQTHAGLPLQNPVYLKNSAAALACSPRLKRLGI